MSSTGVLDIKNPKDQSGPASMPGAMNIGTTANTQTPGVPAPAPNIKAANPPNVDGGPASFSDITQAIADMANAKKSELDASMQAIEANNAVDQAAAAQISGFQSDSLKALLNIQKAAGLPGGAQGEIADLVGLFNSDYNYEYQKTEALIAQQRGQDVATRAAALKEQNNQLPTLLGKVSEAQKVMFEAQRDVNRLAIEKGTLTNQQLQTKIAAAHLALDQASGAREATKFKIDSMSMPQIEAALAQANAGKGPFKGLGGLLEERLMHEKSAVISLQTAQLALQNGDREEYKARMIDTVSHLPTDPVQKLVDAAQAKGLATVTLPVGIDKDGKSTMGEVPIDLVQQGMLQAQKIQDLVNQHVAADQTEKLGIIPTVTNLSNVAQAFAGVDPRATQLMVNMGATMKAMDPKNPNSVTVTGKVLQDLQKQMDVVVKENADKYGTPQARAAIVNFGKTGTFDSVGGSAVIADTTANPALNRNSVFKNTWNAFNQEIANVMLKEHVVATAPTLTGNTTADTMAIIAQGLQKPQGREKLNIIAENILQDPTKTRKLARSIQGSIQIKTINDVLSRMASQKDADPIWKDMFVNSEKYSSPVTDDKGNVIGSSLDAGKIFETLEAMSIRSGGKLNYGKFFTDAVGSFAVNADNDSAYQIQDHAWMATLFGANPSSQIAGDLHWQLRQLQATKHKDMADMINQDISGKTQTDFVRQAAISSGMSMDGPQGGFGSFLNGNPQEIFKKTGVDVSAIPSSTGTGLTVDQIKKLFPGGYN